MFPKFAALVMPVCYGRKAGIVKLKMLQNGTGRNGTNLKLILRDGTGRDKMKKFVTGRDRKVIPMCSSNIHYILELKLDFYDS